MQSDPELRRPYASNVDDRMLFLSVFGIGAFVTVLLKETTSSAILPLAVAVSLQIFYWAMTTFYERFRLREERAGDSYYYLGLLFTLISLADTLWAFARADRAAQTASIISGFGVALGTTIFGLFLRVLVQQFRTDPVEVEYQARNDLVETANELRNNLFGIITDMNAFRQSLRQSVEESMKAAATVASEAMADAAKKFTSEIDGMVKRIDDTFAKFATSAQTLSDRSESTVKALTNLTEKIENIEPPSNVVEMVFGPARDGMRDAAASVRDAADSQKKQLERLGQLVELSIQSTSALEGKTKLISSSIDSINGAIANLGKLGDASNQALASVEAITERLSTTVSGLERVPEGVKSTLDRLVQDLEQSARDLSNKQKEASDAVTNSIKTLAELSGRHTSALEGQLKTVQQASEKIIDGVVGIANRVTEKLS